MTGGIFTLRELIGLRHCGQRDEGTMEGVFASSEARPNFQVRDERFGFRTQLHAALDIGRV
jgi:hypothetical protein